MLTCIVLRISHIPHRLLIYLKINSSWKLGISKGKLSARMCCCCVCKVFEVSIRISFDDAFNFIFFLHWRSVPDALSSVCNVFVCTRQNGMSKVSSIQTNEVMRKTNYEHQTKLTILMGFYAKMFVKILRTAIDFVVF